jgi:hypothetical protein
MWATQPTHLASLNVLILIICGKEYALWSSSHIFSASCYFLPLRSKYFPQDPVLKHPQSDYLMYLI